MFLWPEKAKKNNEFVSFFFKGEVYGKHWLEPCVFLKLCHVFFVNGNSWKFQRWWRFPTSSSPFSGYGGVLFHLLKTTEQDKHVDSLILQLISHAFWNGFFPFRRGTTQKAASGKIQIWVSLAFRITVTVHVLRDVAKKTQVNLVIYYISKQEHERRWMPKFITFLRKNMQRANQKTKRQMVFWKTS